MDKKYQPHLDQIHKLFPAAADQVRVNEGGEDFLVFETGADWMVRFPRNAITQEAFRREVQFLNSFKELSPVLVPDYRYVGDDYGAYLKIQGAPLSFELFRGLSEVYRRKLGRQLAAFLSAIHNFPLAQAAQIGVTNGWNGLHHEAGRYFLEHVTPLLSPTARKHASHCMETLLAERFVGKVIHGDLYLPDHVLYNEEDGQLGVIDFADVTVYDAAHDFQCIVETGGQAFFELVMAHYQGEADFRLFERSKLRLAARPLFVAGHMFAQGFTDQYAARLENIEAVFG